MNMNRYLFLISEDALEFVFVSEGPKGRIQKVVQFRETDNADIYNLSFGDILPNGKIDDRIYGLILNGGNFYPEEFEKGKNYQAFLVKRKKNV